MRIKLGNIVVLVLLLTVLFFLARHGTALRQVVRDINHIGPGHTADQRTAGLLVLGIIAVSVVAIIKLLTQSPPADRPDQRHAGRNELEN